MSTSLIRKIIQYSKKPVSIACSVGIKLAKSGINDALVEHCSFPAKLKPPLVSK